jgi:hypothetical protein
MDRHEATDRVCVRHAPGNWVIGQTFGDEAPVVFMPT